MSGPSPSESSFPPLFDLVMGAGHGYWTIFCSILPFFLNYTLYRTYETLMLCL